MQYLAYAMGVCLHSYLLGINLTNAYKLGNTVEPEDGAFANIVISKEFATMHKPDSLSFSEAASLGVGMVTIGQAFYWVMKLRLPSLTISTEPSAGPALFVYGGSSATGSLAIQVAKQYVSCDCIMD
jgi:NADPH:quinone reductase-like Zn-dependent oxidoreductase